MTLFYNQRDWLYSLRSLFLEKKSSSQYKTRISARRHRLKYYELRSEFDKTALHCVVMTSS